MIRPYQYPLLVGAVPAPGGVPLTVNRTVSTTIPPNSTFVWTHTLNGTVQDAPGPVSVRTQIYDSVNGPLFNVSTETENIAGQVYKTFLGAPRDIRPFPLPETYTFEKGAVLTATYTIILTGSIDFDPSFASVGIILCGYRILDED
jgi:hypothetical protein